MISFAEVVIKIKCAVFRNMAYIAIRLLCTVHLQSILQQVPDSR